MSTSLIYRSATGYGLVMRALYGRHYGARDRAIAERIPPHSSVLDLCCGPATLYTGHLSKLGVRYTGLDINERLLANVTKQGGLGLRWDLHSPDPLPRAEYVVMQASLYHFLPDPRPVLDRMLAAADRLVIVAEPVRNLATSDSPLVAMVGRRMTDPGSGEHAGRFTEATLDALFADDRYDVVESQLIAGGREKLYALRPPAI
jgi:SAM-dependent methyltransferase